MTDEPTANTNRVDKRERARRLIRDLLAKTVANGCTEQEAAEAAQKASDLMDQYNLTMADAQDIKDDTYGARKRVYRNNNHEIIRFSAGSIASFCDCRCYSSDKEVVMFGQQHDTEIAHYLLDIIMNAANHEWRQFYKRQGQANAKARRGFMLGFSHRINKRMHDIKEGRKAQAPATGTDLVVVKTAVVNERYAIHTQDLNFTKSRSIRAVGTIDARLAGQDAANRVNITTGVGHKAKPELLK